MTIEIGNKPLKEMSAEDLKQIVMIEGCCPGLQYWEEPTIIEFDNTMFGTTHVLDYTSYRKSDKLQSSHYTFFFDFKDFRCHYTRDYEDNKNQASNGKSVGLETIKYLIQKGYDVPLYNKP